MNAGLPYQARGRWRLWIAFACAAAIHVGAVVLAKSKSEKNAVQDFRPPGVDVEMIATEPDPTPPDESVIPPPSEHFFPDEEAFPEENRTPTPVRPHKKTRVASFVSGPTARPGAVKASVLYAPRPVYPYEARRQRITGTGIALLTVDPAVGNVTGVRMTQSCGSVALDNATLGGFRRWRFKPGSARNVEVPTTYTLTGASY
jgi:TonB family protein